MSAAERPVSPNTLRRRRVSYGVELALFLVAITVLAVVVSAVARRPELRLRGDATKTRAYALSPQTLALLDDLEGDWTIAIIAAEDAGASANRRQVDEVLRRFATAPNVTVERVDPTDPATLRVYDALLGRVLALERETITAYEAAITDGRVAFGDLRLFAQEQAAGLERLAGRLPAGDPARDEVVQRVGLIGLLAEEGGQVLDAVDAAVRTGDEQPIPDLETARSILAAALSQWADELYALARTCAGWAATGGDPALVQYAAGVGPRADALAARLAAVADPLTLLPPLEAAAIGRQLRRGEAALVLSPDRARVVPGEQLFPRLNVREIGDGAVAFDRRFRGEQVIAAAIRSLRVASMPMVVFVHGESRSLLRATQQNNDVVGVGQLLGGAGYAVREWTPERGERPRPAPGQTAVWVFVPPSSRQELEPGTAERAVLRAAQELVRSGEPVLLSLYPSLLPRYGRPDPWAQVARAVGVRAETRTVIMEAVTVGADEQAYELGQAVAGFRTDHPIGPAVDGQQAFFVLPVPLARDEAAPDTVRVDVLAAVAPSPRRWLEEEWAGRPAGAPVTVTGTPYESAQPIVLAVEGPRPDHAGTARAVVVGSGGWLLTYIADAITPLGSGRALMTNPGNHELMLASIAWLADMDELIAPSPVSRQVARLEGIDGRTQALWGLIGTIVAPLGCLLVGVGVWLLRR